MDGSDSLHGLEATTVDGIGRIGRAAWDRLANPPGEPFDPFLSWDFLESLEATGCVGPGAGWTPVPITLHDRAGVLRAAMPLYLKTHSRGEFVFDHAWADAIERAGGRYYPKLQCAVPFTPVTGRRLLTDPDHRADAPALERALLAAARQLALNIGASSLHLTFMEAPAWQRALDEGMMGRTDIQFHWTNRGYGSFDEVLAAMSSDRRKNLRKERARAQAGLDIRRLTVAALTPAHWDAFFAFYMDSGDRKWGSPYLNRAMFARLHERMAEHCLLVMAFEAGRPIAGALNLIGSDALWGRYWGRLEDRPFLHFELCYYQAIDFAIERGLARVEAGAQGGHKLARGYDPVQTRSAHWIAHPGLAAAVEAYLERERAAVEGEVEALGAHAPWRKEQG